MFYLFIILSATGSGFFTASPEKQLYYLDPGSGSFIFQLIIASLLGGLFILKAYWKRISKFFRHLISRGEDDPEE